MRFLKVLLTAIVAVACMEQKTWADLQFNQMEIAIGLAQVIANAAACGYQIDQAGLERYFEKVGLSTPEGLNYVTVNVPRQVKTTPSPAECTMSRSTGKSIGVLLAQ